MEERYPNLKVEFGGLIPGCEISSLLDKTLPGGQLPSMLWHWHVGLLSPKKIKQQQQQRRRQFQSLSNCQKNYAS